MSTTTTGWPDDLLQRADETPFFWVIIGLDGSQHAVIAHTEPEARRAVMTKKWGPAPQSIGKPPIVIQQWSGEGLIVVSKEEYQPDKHDPKPEPPKSEPEKPLTRQAKHPDKPLPPPYKGRKHK